MPKLYHVLGYLVYFSIRSAVMRFNGNMLSLEMINLFSCLFSRNNGIVYHICHCLGF